MCFVDQVGQYTDFLWEALNSFGPTLPQTQKTIDSYFSKLVDIGTGSVSKVAAIRDASSSSSGLPAAAPGPVRDDILSNRTHVVSDVDDILAFPSLSKTALLSSGNLCVTHWRLVQRRNDQMTPVDKYDIAVKTDLRSEYVRLPLLSIKPLTYPQALYANLVHMKHIKKLPKDLNTQHPVFAYSARVVVNKKATSWGDYKDLIEPFLKAFEACKDEACIELFSVQEAGLKKALQEKRVNQTKFKDATMCILLTCDTYVDFFNAHVDDKVEISKYIDGWQPEDKITVPDIIVTELSSLDLHAFLLKDAQSQMQSVLQPDQSLAHMLYPGFQKVLQQRVLSFYNEHFARLDPCDDMFPASLVNLIPQKLWQNTFQYLKTNTVYFRPITSSEGKALVAEGDIADFIQHLSQSVTGPRKGGEEGSSAEEQQRNASEEADGGQGGGNGKRNRDGDEEGAAEPPLKRSRRSHGGIQPVIGRDTD